MKVRTTPCVWPPPPPNVRSSSSALVRTAAARFFERLVWNPASQFGLETRNRAIAYLGDGLDTRPGRAPDGRAPTVLRCPQDRIREVLGALRALNAGRTPQATKVAGVPLTALRKLLERMRTATYGVIVWAPANLDFPHAELTVEALCDLVRDLNTNARWSGLPVGGDDGAVCEGGGGSGAEGGWGVRAPSKRAAHGPPRRCRTLMIPMPIMCISQHII